MARTTATSITWHDVDGVRWWTCLRCPTTGVTADGAASHAQLACGLHPDRHRTMEDTR